MSPSLFKKESLKVRSVEIVILPEIFHKILHLHISHNARGRDAAVMYLAAYGEHRFLLLAQIGGPTGRYDTAALAVWAKSARSCTATVPWKPAAGTIIHRAVPTGEVVGAVQAGRCGTPSCA